MAGIENIVIHSQSYLVRWISVSEHHSISWSVQPHKKSINFGIFKHPGSKNGLTPVLPTFDNLEQPPTPGLGGIAVQDGAPQDQKRSRRNSILRHDSAALVEKLRTIGMKPVAWNGKCEADRVSTGRYDVPDGEAGMYGLVLDNTFSKNTSKTVLLSMMTHPTNAPPKSGTHLHYSQAFASSQASVSASLDPSIASQEELGAGESAMKSALQDTPRPMSRSKGSSRGVELRGAEGVTFYTGVLHKKRRKKAQGYARRFFSMDFTSSTLSYYRNRHSSALRGAVPLSLAVIGVDDKTREFSVDSGAEIWHLKAGNRKDFEGWKQALERASQAAFAISTPVTAVKTNQSLSLPNAPNPTEQREWSRVEELVSRVSGTRDAIRGLAKDTDPKYASSANGVGLGLTTSNGSSGGPSPTAYDAANNYFPEVEESAPGRRPFWKRKPSVERSPSGFMRRTVSAQLSIPGTPSASASPAMGGVSYRKPSQVPATQPSFLDDNTHERCMALLRDLDNVVLDFSALIAESKARRNPPLSTTMSRMSIDSVRDEEFFDAEDGLRTPVQLLNIRRSSEFDESAESQPEDHLDAGSSASSDGDDTAADGSSMYATTPRTGKRAVFAKPTSIPPLPLPSIKRRTTVIPPKQAPPSIIGFLRKNAGKDLSTVSMPVTANEPTSALQRVAENLEYSHLLDSAASSSLTPAERLLHIAAFALSTLSANRVKERALRKPFNPMLGETFELVREDLGFRFVAEKISHHPVRMACQAESLTNGGWSFAQAPQPTQKFWGKSVELNTEGRCRVQIFGAGEGYSWSQPTCFLRNVIAGEKYVEPVHNLMIIEESGEGRAVCTFKAGGMFSGRSEDVTVQLLDRDGTVLPLGLTGKWTDSLIRTDTNKPIWTAGALVPDSAKHFGFTAFAATLNETTENESGFLAPTDSRLRPDQRAYEHGNVDDAEAMKAKLEERQRSRRKVLEGHGKQWEPRFFERVEGAGEETWRLKDKGGYWDRRVKGDWNGVEEVFEL
ncbi:hypothetical protein B0A48_15982 [Cryoendolithus antarcticus]|uniref:PH domain-containing protein n=1 Tax=Cryoendolithus antarcticus TaxID=1507870 RepID=A0A1V8SGQ8_9PEZI|nr:hypothetical protein B0A48_15982 [Cryoendolithus antarcticus]